MIASDLFMVGSFVLVLVAFVIGDFLSCGIRWLLWVLMDSVGIYRLLVFVSFSLCLFCC